MNNIYKDKELKSSIQEIIGNNISQDEIKRLLNKVSDINLTSKESTILTSTQYKQLLVDQYAEQGSRMHKKNA